jgi:hypothetical protein
MAAKKKTATVVAVVAGAAVFGGILYFVLRKPTPALAAAPPVDPCAEARLLASIQNPAPSQVTAAANWAAQCRAKGGTV